MVFKLYAIQAAPMCNSCAANVNKKVGETEKQTQIMMKTLWKSVICMSDKLLQNFLCLDEDKLGCKTPKTKTIQFGLLSSGNKWLDLIQPASCLHSKKVKEVSLNKKFYHIRSTILVLHTTLLILTKSHFNL